MASEMIERVALAMTSRDQTGRKFTPDEARMYARAAIEAMREPSTAMVDSGVAFSLNVSVGGENTWSRHVRNNRSAALDT